MFTADQHKETSHRLQVIQNHIYAVASNIRNSTPGNTALYHSTVELSPVPSLYPDPIKVLRRTLDNEAHREMPGRGPLKLYDIACQPDFKCPDLLPGVPAHMAEDYLEKKTERSRGRHGKKNRLDLDEITAISLFLDYCTSEISRIGHEVTEHYGATHQAATAALEAVRAIQKLSFALATVRPMEVKP